ncbi:MAG: helix-turn-helix domain-containing protein [Sutterella sp.]|nr:helix-turn-helix domain-containing protein [Sutterella sp.]MDO5531016.1 helix-turn-helix domain-containing protein [Sutterella sp.]
MTPEAFPDEPFPADDAGNGADDAEAFEFQDEGNSLEEAVVRQLDLYFARLGGRTPHPLYELVVHAVERPLIDYAMTMCRNNQCAAAELLGINRNTLRKKLQEHGIVQARGVPRKLKEK